MSQNAMDDDYTPDDTDDFVEDPSSQNGPATEPAGTGDDELARLTAENKNLFDRLARATAEFQNSRKRLESDMEQRLQYANQQLIKSLLPVIDNFERALAVDVSKADAASVLKGMQIVHDQWLSVLKQQSVEVIAPAPGEPFDPNRQEALMQQESDFGPNAVVQLLQKGYTLRDRTIRPAQVTVSQAD